MPLHLRLPHLQALSRASSSTVSTFLHLPFPLHISWDRRCVPDVPQTLFSTIKLLSLPSPAAARITWAEQALLNIEQRREGGDAGGEAQREKQGREEGRVVGRGREGRAGEKKRGAKKRNRDAQRTSSTCLLAATEDSGNV